MPAALLLLAGACDRVDRENVEGPNAPAQVPPQAQTGAPAAGAPLPIQRAAVDQAAFTPEAAVSTDRTPAVLRAQVLLDRLRFSPGVIDGTPGENVRQAIAAFEAAQGLPVDGQLDETVFARLTQLDREPVLSEYVITDADVVGPFVETVPGDLEAQGRLAALSYTSPLEALAERFHMTEQALQALNPNVDFGRAGQRIVVANVGNPGLPSPVQLIEVDKAEKAVRVYGADRRLLAFYPATIGSETLPTPGGSMTVQGVAPQPDYTYDPKKLTSGKADKLVKVAAGPNNPVGSVWIDLTKDTYGIHGTPEPRLIGKSASSGCVRLTNWDAEELASQVKPGVPVVFVGEGGKPQPGQAQPAQPAQAPPAQPRRPA